ncbi:tetratricopeptide repeat protein [Streptomyces sp. NBC_01795]|uniref:tetratricopeptide repeat protein n=1 Tax=unclassified Streptomyces TaxID=2593676 RepID=UPI002DD87057|nr:MULTISPECIES: tetratricopeptide repeat protein [unclassified Streptomyces]WSA94542.1 tetratricopeptide repeat protein [Streptomyces sp. NBC_01795]WSB78962.1 tetratricopeptide repeat protein [Streptomyces sp. NBC_01775]WSS12836.1 tetratricopeptide repeat protein [Streptomyces sp. NBC_01186]
MASSASTSPSPQHSPNTAFRALRGLLSPGEFAAAVRRSAREIGEQVSCDARYIGRVESGEIRCPNYAYERVFLHMFPGYSLMDMGFAPRESVRGRAARVRGARGAAEAPRQPTVRCGESMIPRVRQEPPARPDVRAPFTFPPPVPLPPGPVPPTPHDPPAFDEFDALTRLAALAPHTDHSDSLDPIEFANCPENNEESDVLRRAFMTGGPAALAAASLSGAAPGSASAASAAARRPPRPASPQAGDAEARAVESAVRQIRVLDDRHGGAGLYRRAGESLRAAYELLDAGTRRQSVSDRLHSGAGELAISVGWLAHDSGRYHDARSHYAEALATARVAGDAALEAHAFCNTAFLARDAGRPREAVRAAQAGQQAAKQLGSHHLLSLLALREAGGWAGLGDRPGCQQALARAQHLFAQGPSDSDPEWMSFFGEAELEGLEAQCWSALGLWERAAEHAQRAVALQNPHFTRNRALFTAELAGDLAAQGQAEEAAAAGSRALDFLGPVQSTRISAMLETAAGRLRSFRREPAVAGFLARHAATA